MWGQSKQATSATMAVAFITIGALVDVWTIIGYIWLSRNNGSDNSFLMCHGLLFSGLVFIVVGVLIGRIGRSARQAEVAATPATVVAPQAPVATAPAVAVDVNGQPVAMAPAAAPGVAPAPRTTVATGS